MKSEIKYELPMFSSNLENEPQIEFKNMNVKIIIKGYDENDVICETEIKFISVIGFKQTSPRFTPKLYGAYDKVVEVIDSEWLEELKKVNEEDFSYWKPKHYILYLDGFGMYQFIAQSLEVEK